MLSLKLVSSIAIVTLLFKICVKMENMREINVRGDGNCFYRAVSLWNDLTTDINYPKIREQVNQTIASHPEVFQPYVFGPDNIQQHLQKSTCDRAWAETVDMVACASLFQRQLFTYSMSKRRWYRFEPVARAFPTT